MDISHRYRITDVTETLINFQDFYRLKDNHTTTEETLELMSKA